MTLGAQPSATSVITSVGTVLGDHPYSQGQIARAEALGVKRLHGALAGADDLRHRPDHVVAAGVSARWLLGADGLHSTVRQAIGGEGPPRARPRYGQRRHFAVEPWTDLVEVHSAGGARRAEAYVTPVGPGEVGVAILSDVRGPDHDEWLWHFPVLRAHLTGAPPT